MEFTLNDQKKEFINAIGYTLVMGGPGSGKTTMALLKSKQIVTAGINKFSKVLFLSFARATIARVEEQSQEILAAGQSREQLEINTYHGFCWKLLKSHGYLLRSRPINLLTPPEAAAKLADFSTENEKVLEKNRLFDEDGLLHFDLFASKSAELLSRSSSLAEIISTAYPVVILDEFQDTNQSEWDFIKELGKRSKLVALADLDQRIYEFRGADPNRIPQFIEEYQPLEFDFGNENNRSNGTDILKYGNDILSGANKTSQYKDVECIYYRYYKTLEYLPLKVKIFELRKNLIEIESNDRWSIAVLVPTKNLMLAVSSFLNAEQRHNGRRYSAINHEVALESAGPSLAAVMIASLMGREEVLDLHLELLRHLTTYIRGHKNNPSQASLKLASALEGYVATGQVRGKNRIKIVSEAKSIGSKIDNLVFEGDPALDWVKIRQLLINSSSPEIKQVGEDAKYLRLLRKGAVLNAGLGGLWRSYGNYKDAETLVRNALLQEHFSMASIKSWQGVHVMTIHKSKGKEFDKVIIYDGPSSFRDRILWNNPTDRQLNQTKLALRVAVTRAKRKAVILTPGFDPCKLL